jgi:hypothetical protein
MMAAAGISHVMLAGNYSCETLIVAYSGRGLPL